MNDQLDKNWSTETIIAYKNFRYEAFLWLRYHERRSGGNRADMDLAWTFNVS